MIRAYRFLPGLSLAVLSVLLVGPVAPALGGTEPAQPTLEETVAALEARVQQLEIFLAEALGYGDEDSAAPAATGELTLPVRITRKHFAAQDAAHDHWEDFIELDVEIDTTPLSRPAVALKGMLQFADAFGQVHFTMPVQINDNIKPGSSVRQKGLDFEYNQFDNAHKWMMSTEAKKMVVAYQLSAIMYADGATELYR